MKNLFKFIVILVLSVLSFTHSYSQNYQESGLYIRATMATKVADVYNEQIIYCDEELVVHFVNKRNFIAKSSKFELKLKVVHRNIGEYKSWLALDTANRYFFITPFRFEKNGFGVIIQPVDKRYNRMYDLPVITIANFNVCEIK